LLTVFLEEKDWSTHRAGAVDAIVAAEIDLGGPMKLVAAVFSVVLLGTASPLLAQSTGWTAEFSGGGAAPVNDISSRLTTGWDVDVAAGYQFRPWFAVLGDFGYAGMGVPDAVLQESAAPGGHGRILSMTLGPEFRFPLTSRFQGFVLGGVGWIRRTVDLTAPSVQSVDNYDPFYGDLGIDTFSTDIVLSSVTRNALGGDFGGGVSLPIGDTGTALFVDVRYYYAPTSPRVTAMIPVMFGIRWTASGARP
jgi:hypothetical protein